MSFKKTTILGVLLLFLALIITGCGKKIVIKFETIDGIIVSEQTIKKSGIPKEPTPPIREGYEFLYWEINGEKYDFDKEISEDATLIAKWQPIVEDTLKDKKLQALAELEEFYNTFKKEDYTTENWNTLTNHYNDGLVAIDAAEDLEAVDDALQEAINNMESVDKLPEEE